MLYEKLTRLAIGVDARIGKRVVIRSFKDHPWLLAVDPQMDEMERAVIFRALVATLVRFGPDSMIAVLPVSPKMTDHECIEYILMVGVHVSSPEKIPSLEHLCVCRDHQQAMYDAFSDFLSCVGFALGALEGADSIFPVRFTCPS